MLNRILSVGALAMALSLGFQANAGELDNEQAVTNAQVQAAKELPSTLVIRVSDTTKAVEVLHTNDKLPADASAAEALSKANFMKMDVKQGMGANGELDRDSSSSSWYFCWPTYNWYYPTYYYGGYSYNYSSYYNYNWGGYSYYYYGWGYNRWW